MPLETELKLRVQSHEPARERLRALGARCLGNALEENIILDRPDGSLRGRGMGLRVRLAVPEGGGEPVATLTLKGPRLPGVMKSRPEYEVVVDDHGVVLQILHTLGFLPILKYEKRRESWLLGECRVELDEPVHIGRFIEIEGPDTDAIRAAQRDLSLEDCENQPSSYVHMLLTYCAEHGIADRVVSFT